MLLGQVQLLLQKQWSSSMGRVPDGISWTRRLEARKTAVAESL